MKCRKSSMCDQILLDSIVWLRFFSERSAVHWNITIDDTIEWRRRMKRNWFWSIDWFIRLPQPRILSFDEYISRWTSIESELFASDLQKSWYCLCNGCDYFNIDVLHKISVSMGYCRWCKVLLDSYSIEISDDFRNWALVCSLINAKIPPLVCWSNMWKMMDDLVSLDMLTVNETANEPPPEDGTMDSAKSLGVEAVFINHNFAQQVLKMVLISSRSIWLIDRSFSAFV